MSDEELAKKAMEGNMDSYEILVRRYEAPLLRYVAFLIGDLDAAEDCVQITFIKTYQNLQSFNAKRKFSSWIYRIAHNSAMDHIRRNRLVHVDDKFMENLTAKELPPAALIDMNILAQDVKHCITKLEPKYREPILLYYFRDKSYREISDILRLPASTVGVRISRAKHMLKEICAEMEAKLW